MTRWNASIQYHRVLLDALPARASTALDVGCGEGIFTRALRARVERVTGIDAYEPSIALAREHPPDDGIDYVAGDFVTHPFADASFDAVCCVAALHHMSIDAALARMAALVKPGGVVGVIGLARSSTARDYAFDAAGAVATRARRVRTSVWETPSPKLWPPPQTHSEVQRTVAQALPGAQWRRRVMFRYTVVWTKPVTAPT